MTEEKAQYDTSPKSMNELKAQFEAGGGDWKAALQLIDEATGGKSVAEAMKEGWTVADFAKILSSDGDGGQATEAPKQSPVQATEHSFTEAPASFNVKAISPQGFDVMLTLRDADTMELMKRGDKALDWLISKGYQPTGRRGGNGGNGSSGNDNPDTKICPIHHAPMKKREKDGQVWYSHKAVNPDSGEEYWCKGVAKKVLARMAVSGGLATPAPAPPRKEEAMSVIPIGTKVKIKDGPMLIPKCLAGCRAIVVGYEHDPPTPISLHYLERSGDVTFKYPSQFSWELEIIEEEAA